MQFRLRLADSAQDVSKKTQLKPYVGMGYTYGLLDLVPLLKYIGVPDSQIRNMLVENPKRILCYWVCVAPPKS
jgi:predicted metal-dependent phosphotriesterase family hydrolase